MTMRTERKTGLRYERRQAKSGVFWRHYETFHRYIQGPYMSVDDRKTLARILQVPEALMLKRCVDVTLEARSDRRPR